MKTPEEIKKGLACESILWTIGCSLDCDNCERYVPGYEAEPCAADALAYIQQLESRLAQAERERDAAVSDLETVFWFSWQWRGVCPENSKRDSE